MMRHPIGGVDISGFHDKQAKHTTSQSTRGEHDYFTLRSGSGSRRRYIDQANVEPCIGF